MKKTYAFIGHLIFWLALLSFPSYGNISTFGWFEGSIRLIPPSLSMIALAYLNIFVIVPKVFRFKKARSLSFLPFLIYLPITILTGAGVYGLIYLLNQWSDIEAIFRFTIYQDDRTKVLDTGNFEHLPLLFSFLSVTLILFVSSLYALALEFIRRERQAAKLAQENLKNELKFLRAQINPHFLFNAMNNLYAIVQLQPETAGEFVLKLSDMLRYVTYECKEDKVSLEKEIKYLQNYIFFQRKRDKTFQNIEVNLDVPQASQIRIEPMLLVPFVENCFKHSYTDEPENRWIRIQLRISDKQLIFETQNSIPPISEGDQRTTADEYMGIGIENIQRRLELLYPNMHRLEIEHQAEQFGLKLVLDLP